MTKVLVDDEVDEKLFSLWTNVVSAVKRAKSAVREARSNDPDLQREILNDVKKAWYTYINAIEERFEKDCKEVTDVWTRRFRPRFVMRSGQMVPWGGSESK